MIDPSLREQLQANIDAIMAQTQSAPVSDKKTKTSSLFEGTKQDGDVFPTSQRDTYKSGLERSRISANKDNEKAGCGKKDQDVNAAYCRIVRLIDSQERSRVQLEERLARLGFDEVVIQKALDRASSCGLLDDQRFAEMLVYRRIGQGYGLLGIERELRKNNIVLESLEGWPYEYGLNPENEVDRALDFLHKKPSRAKNKYASAYRRLGQRGFSKEVAARAAHIWALSCTQRNGNQEAQC